MSDSEQSLLQPSGHSAAVWDGSTWRSDDGSFWWDGAQWHYRWSKKWAPPGWRLWVPVSLLVFAGFWAALAVVYAYSPAPYNRLVSSSVFFAAVNAGAALPMFPRKRGLAILGAVLIGFAALVTSSGIFEGDLAGISTGIGSLFFLGVAAGGLGGLTLGVAALNTALATQVVDLSSSIVRYDSTATDPSSISARTAPSGDPTGRRR